MWAVSCLVERRLCGLGLVCLEERAGGDCSCATFKFLEGADTIVEELEGLKELVGGYFTEHVIGEKEGILCVVERMGKEDAQLVEHLNGPED